MPSIRYLGPTDDDIDVLTRLRVQAEISGTLTTEKVQDETYEALRDKANSFYLSDVSSQYVGPSAMSGRGDNLIRKNLSGQANGMAPLSGGRIPGTSYLPNAYDRPGGRGWGIQTYTNSNLSITTGAYSSEILQQIGSFTINGPSSQWLPIFTGFFVTGLGKGEILIMRSGRIFGRSIGGNHTQQWFPNTTVPIDPTPLSGSATFTIHRRAFFGGTMHVGVDYTITCMMVPY